METCITVRKNPTVGGNQPIALASSGVASMPTIGLESSHAGGAAKVSCITELRNPAARVYQPVALKRTRRGRHREEAYDKCQCNESIKVVLSANRKPGDQVI